MSARHHRLAIVSTLITVFLLAACSSTPAVSVAPIQSSTGGQPSVPATTPAPATNPPASNAPASSKAGPVVDLTFTETIAFVAKGPLGKCGRSTFPDGSSGFSYELEEKDAPGAGPGFGLEVGGAPIDFLIKWLAAGDHYYFSPSTNSLAQGLQTSPDHLSVTIDFELAPAGTPKPGPEHVKGTITCVLAP